MEWSAKRDADFRKRLFYLKRSRKPPEDLRQRSNMIKPIF
jgi:hypothetical protein